MANSELSKLKILFIYDYFKNRVSCSGGSESVSVSDLIKYLEECTGCTFERKSIYADINKINEYVTGYGIGSAPGDVSADIKSLCDEIRLRREKDSVRE